MTDFEVKVTHELLSSQSVGETKIERKRLHGQPHTPTSRASSSGDWSVMRLGGNCAAFLQVDELQEEGLAVPREQAQLTLHLADKIGRQEELRKASPWNKELHLFGGK